MLWPYPCKEKEKQRQAELQEKKEIAERRFKEWLENAKNKPRPPVKSYGYANGRLTGTWGTRAAGRILVDRAGNVAFLSGDFPGR